MPEWLIITISTLAATIRVSTPLIFCAMAGVGPVSAHVTGEHFAPDPECPRVIDHAAHA